MNRPWTLDDLAALRRMRCVEALSHEAIAAALGRTPLAVQVRLSECGWRLTREAKRAGYQRGAAKRRAGRVSLVTGP